MHNITRKTVFSVVITSILLLAGCSGDQPTQPTDYGFGMITGRVSLLNETDVSSTVHPGTGVLVSLRDSAMVVIDSVTTDSTGYWQLNNIQAGTYDVLLTKNGYAPTTTVGYLYSGRKDITTFRGSTIGQIPLFNVDSLSAVVQGDSVTISGSVSGTAPYRRYILIYLDADSVVSNQHYAHSYYSLGLQPFQSSFRISLSLPYLATFYFRDPSVQAWVAAYSFVPGSTIGPFGAMYYITSVGSGVIRTNFMMP
jgi:hypothetical protein